MIGFVVWIHIDPTVAIVLCLVLHFLVATSSCEAEYRVAFIATVKCVWLQKLLVDLLVGQIAPTVIHANSQSALVIARNPVFHARTKHIEVHYHYVRE